MTTAKFISTYAYDAMKPDMVTSNDRKFDLLAPPDYTLIMRAIDAQTAYLKAMEGYIAAAEDAPMTVAVCLHCHKPF